MKRVSVRRLAVASCAALVLSVATRTARADDTADVKRAEALFEEGRALMAAKRFSEACPKFAKSQALAPAGGTLLNLAECYDKAGKTASAWIGFKQVADRARAAGRADVEKLAEARVRELEPQVSKLTIVVPPASRVRGLEIRRDGNVVESDDWDKPAPADPGPHVVMATAPDSKPLTTTIGMLANGASATVSLPTLEDASAPTAPPDATPKPGVARNASGRRTLGFVVGSVGVAGLAMGSVAGVIAMGKHSDAKAACPEYPTCATHDADTANDQTRTWATVSTVGFIAGGALVAFGAVLILTAPSESTPTSRIALHRPHAEVLPVVGRGMLGVSLGGAF